MPRNQKQENEPPGLTGNKLGSWRYSQMMKKRRDDRNFAKEEKKAKKKKFWQDQKLANSIRKLEINPVENFVFVENEFGHTYKQLCSVNEMTVGDMKDKMVSHMMNAIIYTAGGAKDIEVFYPYCKMARDDNITLSNLGVKNGMKIHYRFTPGVTVYAP